MDIKYGTQLKFADIPIGDFFMGNDCIFQSVKSKDAMKITFSPETPVMVCYYPLLGDRSQFAKGDVTEDYFQSSFTYISSDKKLVDTVIQRYDQQRKS